MQPRLIKSDSRTAAPTRGNDVNPQPLHALQVADALLRLKTAGVALGVSEVTVRRFAAKDPTFPKLIRLGNRCTRIRAGDLTAWMAAQGTDAAAGA